MQNSKVFFGEKNHADAVKDGLMPEWDNLTPEQMAELLVISKRLYEIQGYVLDFLPKEPDRDNSILEAMDDLGGKILSLGGLTYEDDILATQPLLRPLAP